MAVDVPEADLFWGAGVDPVAAVRVEDVDAAGAADADLVLEVDVVARRVGAVEWAQQLPGAPG
jgi:hypothetical protein